MIELLGVPRISAGSTIALPTRKALALVAVVALDGPTTRARLARLLWGRQPPEDGRRNLRQELHRLHATPLSAVLRVSADAVELSDAEIDVRRFRAAVDAGDCAEAVSAYAGPLMAHFELKEAPDFDAWLEQERETLARAWRAAAARCVRQLQHAGEFTPALALVRRLLDENPLDESCHRDAMRLLQLQGDRAAALAQFDTCRRLLHEELHVEPSAETAALASEIRTGDARPSNASTPDPSLPELVAPLIGRDAAWTALEQATDRLALIQGAAGVGKTRLAEDFARAHGRVLVLRGREVARGTPFYPVAEALLEAYRADSRWFELLDPVWRVEVTRLLPLLSEDDTGSQLPASEARGRLIEGLFAALVTAAQGGAILFDDMHWFDGATAELVAHLARKAARVRLLGTVRNGEFEQNPAVQAALATMERDRRLAWVRLAPLDENGVLKLVRALSGSTGAQVFSRRLHGATAGNPLFILETLRDLFSAGVLRRTQGTWETPYDHQTEDYRELPISRTVREAVLRRIDRLGTGVRQVLEAASLAGDGFLLAWLGECTALSELELVSAVDRAAGAEVLVEAGSGYRFAHSLIRRSLDDALSSGRRKLLHQRLAAAMAREGAPPADVAAHLEAAGRRADAIEHRLRAAREAERMYALREALGHCRMALADGATGSVAFGIHSNCVELCRNLGDEPGRRDALQAMRALCDTADDPALQVQTAVKEIVDHFEHDRYDDALQAATLALAQLRDRVEPQDEAALMLELGATLKVLGRLDEAEAHLRVALERYRHVSPLKYANCAYWLCQCAIERADFALAGELSDLSLASAERAGYRRGHALTLRMKADIALRRGAVGAGIGFLEAALREASEIGSRALQRSFLQSLIETLREAGRLEEAERRGRELDALGPGPNV